MKKYILLLTIASILLSCNKIEQPPVTPEDTPEEILLAVQNTYTVSSVSEKGQKYQFTFASVTPISLKKEYPEGIPSIAVNRTDVSELRDNGKNIEVFFTSGKRALLTYDSWLQVEFQDDAVSFTEDRRTDKVSFLVKETKTDDITVTVSGHEDFSSAKTDYDPKTRIGTVSFSCTSGDYFVKTVSVEVSNGKQSVRHEVSATRVNFKFSDGSTSKAFDFLDYERYFEIEMSKADTAVHVSVPQDCAGWIRAAVSHVNVNSEDRTFICVLLSENAGSGAREVCLHVTRTGIEQTLPIEIRQISSQMEGSLRKGLESFYKALNGRSWNNSENWCSGKPLFEWYGIEAALVTSKSFFGDEGFAYFGTDDRWNLNLAANNMRGEIPMDFWKACKCFENIRISSEYLPTSTVPDCVWHKGLQSLDLSMSFMNVPLGIAIGNAENLTRLNIQACSVNGSLPAALTSLASLEQVNMRECGITGELPSAIGDMKALREFCLDHNMELGGTLPDSFYNLENLTDFDISATRIGGQLKPAISSLKKLEGFWITGCEFEGTIPEEFGLIDNLIGYDFDGNYFTSLPEFVRYYGYNSKYAKEWVGSAGFPIGVPYYQRIKSDGRPENYVVVVPDCSEMSEILVNGQPLKRPGYYVDFSKCRQLPFPVWARVRYGIWCWTIGRIDEMKYPKYPSADDLQYPGNEYYFDGKDWRHAKLEYPAREYYYDGQKWVHDPSCPWDKEYVDPIGE